MELNFAAVCAAVEAAVPDREALVWRDRRWSWRDVGDRTRRLARAFVDAGLGTHGPLGDLPGWASPHDHVALYLYNGNEYLEGMLAAYQARCAPLNVNYRYRATELHHVLADSSAKVVVFDGRFGPTLAEVLPGLPSIELLVQVDDEPTRLLDGALRYEDLLASSTPELPLGLIDGWSGDDLYICYTGGTTGLPKGVLWRQHDFLASALGLDRVGGRPVEDVAQFGEAARTSTLRALPAPPLMHGAAHWNAMSCWAAGGTVVIQDDTTRLDPADLWRTVDRHRATSLLIVGDPFARPLVDELDRATFAGTSYDTSSLRHVLSGGTVLSPVVRDALMARLPHVTVVDVLGSTESGRQGIARTAPRSGSSSGGEPGAFTAESDAVVLSEDRTARLTPGSEEVGWLAKRGLVPRGYLGDRERTEQTFPVVEGARLAVAGDRARLAADGSIELLGRDSVTINTGGEKVFAEEVESVLKEHPAVFDVIVCGIASERWGQEVTAVVQLRDDHRPAPTDDEIRAWCRVRLADFKAPKGIVRVAQVVRSPSGKPDYAWARRVASG